MGIKRKEKMKNYCFYYKGEKENPHKVGTDINRWWWHESVYFREGLPKDHKHWEESALNELHSIPAIEPIMCDYDVPIETKGFLCYTVASTMGHAPMEDFWYLADYGRGFLPERIWDGSHEDVPMTEEELHKLCRYYKGGDQNPFEMDNPRYTFWEIEKTWAKLVANDPHRSSKYLVPFLLAFDGGLPGFPVDETIKATMYEHFIRFGGSKDAFCQYLTNYVNLAL